MLSMLPSFLIAVAAIVKPIDANNFLRAKPAPHASRGHMNEESVRASLLEETEGALGAGTTARRVKKLEAALRPMFASLPKNEYGNLAQATARYALHRLFVQQHAWYIKGLEPDGGAYNTSSPTDVLEDHPVLHLQELFEGRLKQHGFNLHDIAVFAATLEHLIHQEALDSTEQAYELNNYSQKDLLSQEQVDDVIRTHMKIYIAGDSASRYSDEQFSLMYPGWADTKVFLRDMRKNVMYAEGDHSKSAAANFPTRQPTNHVFTPALVTRVLEEVHDNYGVFQDSECKQMKMDLLKHGDHESGLVSLSSFYQAALEHGSQLYSEARGYLRELGALEESDPEHPYVIVPNYITSKTNCISTSSLHSICCINECESLIGHLESEISSPEAEPKRIVELITNLPSSSVQAPRSLSQRLLARLEEIAQGHRGTVPLHGRLFAQWMHHAYPRECPYPHASGTKNPQTPDEWMRQTGHRSTSASEEEMRRVVDDHHLVDTANVEKDLLWSWEEELLVARKPAGSRDFAWGLVRVAMYFAAVLSAIFAFPMLFKQINGFPSACSAVAGSFHELPQAHPTLLRASLSCRSKTTKLDKQLV
jgi:hypothetical protein